MTNSSTPRPCAPGYAPCNECGTTATHSVRVSRYAVPSCDEHDVEVVAQTRRQIALHKSVGR